MAQLFQVPEGGNRARRPAVRRPFLRRMYPLLGKSRLPEIREMRGGGRPLCSKPCGGGQAESGEGTKASDPAKQGALRP